MVCKRSLYCWKNGPCASDQARKQIWEDNIKFRKNLKDNNQSDHYWSFQISRNLCLCLEEEELLQSRQFFRKYRSNLTHKLNEVDCASITHDCNGLRHRNCYIHDPVPTIKNDKMTITDILEPQTLHLKKNVSTCTKDPLKTIRISHKIVNEKPIFCPRYKNTLSDSNLNPRNKFKFPSQLNLSSTNKAMSSLQKTPLHYSCENVRTLADTNKIPTEIHDEKIKISEKNCNEGNKEATTPLGYKTNDKQKEIIKHSNALGVHNKSRNQENCRGYTPVSRTTKKMLLENKKLPFLTFGCNNKNINIGSKRTHNVLASNLEVYPNALLAKQNKRDSILKYLQSEKEFQKKCLLQNMNKDSINHSSLWSTYQDLGKAKINSPKNRSKEYAFPPMSVPLKKTNERPKNQDQYYHKVYRQPQIYFY